MTREYSNEEFGFGSSAYAEPAQKREEDKIAKSSSTPAKIQQAAVTAVAPPAQAASVAAPVAEAAALPALPAASSGEPPAIQNPAQSLDFWSSALKGVGIPIAAGAGLGLLGGAAYSKLKGGGGTTAPTVDEDLRQLRLAQEQAKLDALLEKQARQRELHEANLAKLQPAAQAPAATTPVAEAGLPSTSQQFSVQPKPVDYSLTAPSTYGEQKLNAPTGAPNVAVAPPAEVAPAPVQPKPVSELEQLRLEKARFDLEAAKAKEARAAEAHAARLAADAKRAEAKAQAKTASGALTPETQKMLESSERAKAEKAIIASQKAAAVKAAPPVASVAPPATPTAPAATVAATPPVVPPLTKEQKGMKNYLVSQYGGGPEGEAAYKKVIDILGEVPAYEKGQGGGLSKEANEAIKTWRQENIHGPKVNLTHDMKKALKGAGGIAILAAIPGFAEAAQRKDYGAMSDIASDFLVLPFAQSREVGMPKAQEESIIASKFKEASKLGSPYRSVSPPR